MKRSLFSALARKSLADVTRRKGRTALVVFGILIGVFGLTAINVAAGALGDAFAYSASRTATPNIELAVQSVDPALAPELAAVPNVNAVQIATVYRSRWQIAASPGHVNISIFSYQDLAHIQLYPFQVTAGHLPGDGEILMESSDRSLQTFTVGDLVAVAGPSGPVALRVSGLARTLGTYNATLNGSAIAYMTAAALSAASGVATPNDITVRVNDTHLEQQTTRDLVAVLRAHHITLLNAAITDGSFDPTPLDGLFTIMRVLSGIALLLTSFLIINTVTTLVAEQTSVIGTMKALGAGRWEVMRSYLTSVGIYSVIGTILGIGLGIAGGYWFTQYLTNVVTLDTGPFQVDPSVILLSAAVGLGVPVAAAVVPLWAGTAITVRAALARYGMSARNGGSARPHATSRGSWLPQTVRLSLRSLFRRRTRALLTLVALTLSGTAFLAIATTTYSLNGWLNQLVAQYDTDAFVNTSPRPYAQLRAQLLAIPNMKLVERLEQTFVKTHWGQLQLTGTEVNPQLYHYKLIAGRLFTADDSGAILLSDVATRLTGLKVGDSITVSNATGDVTWNIIGEVHDLNSGLGTIGTAFTTIRNLHQFEGIPADVGSNLIVQGVDRSPRAVDRMAIQIDDTLSAAGLNPSVSTAQEEVSRNQSQFQVLYVLLYSVSAIVGLVGVLGLFNTLTTSVLERRREIGMLRSMGARGRTVAGVFWTEGLALASIAWVVAVVLGIPAAFGFVSLLRDVLLHPLPFAFDSTNLLIMLPVILFIATLASVIPALSASRLRIAEILRYE